MSRKGRLPVQVPGSVKVEQKGELLTVQGPKGALQLVVRPICRVDVQGQEASVEIAGRGDRGHVPNAFQGLYRALLANMVIGVTKGWEKQVQLIGVGFRAMVEGHELVLQLGYSQPRRLQIPQGLTVSVEKPKKGADGLDVQALVTITGTDRQQVGEFAALIRAQRKPEPYKGKGVRYVGEFVRRKEGKAGKGSK